MSFNKDFLPKRDSVFTTMFLNKDLCETVLNIVLDEKVELVDILAEFQNNLKDAALNSVYFDILTRTTDGTIITFDLQNEYKRKRLENRIVYYACREIANQSLTEEEKSKYENLKSVIVTFVLTNTPKSYSEKVRKIRLVDEKTGEQYSNLLTLYEINLKRIDSTDNVEMQLLRDFFAIDTEELYNEFVERYKEDKLAKMLLNEYRKATKEHTLKDILNMEEEDKFMIKLTEKERAQERAEGREEGREEGLQEGMQKGMQEAFNKAINKFVSRFKMMNMQDNEIISNLMADFDLTQEEAQKYLSLR